MKYEVYSASALSYHINEDLLSGQNGEYFHQKLGAFDEVHIIQPCPDALARLGFQPSVDIDLSWVKDTSNEVSREARLKRLVGYLDRYSETYSEALRVYNLMVVSNVVPTKEFFAHYQEMLDFLGGKMQIC
jgi:hypothetical protein